jgi:hypothetical protein
MTDFSDKVVGKLNFFSSFMALHLKDQVHDQLLLPFPAQSKFDYISLIQLANDLLPKTLISYQEWHEMARSHFEFSQEQSRMYFETCVLFLNDPRSLKTFPGDDAWILKTQIPKLVLVTFLFNQLHSVALSQSSFRIDAEFPPSLETQHNPLGVIVDPVSRSNTIEDLDSELSDKQTILPFPSLIRDSRNQLSLFWRSNVRKWLIAVFVTLYGSDHVIESTSGQHYLNFEPKINDLSFLTYFFVGVGPAEDTEEFQQTICRFKEWYEKKELSPLTHTSSHFKYYKIEQILAKYVSLGNVASTVPFDLLVHLLQFTIMDSPLTFEMVQISPIGKVMSTQHHSSPIRMESPENVPLLISRKRGRTLLIEPTYARNRSIIVHRLYDCQLYLFGAVDNVIVSNCRNTSIFVPIVTNTMSVISCSGVSIAGAITAFRIDCEAETANIQPNSVHLCTPTRPLVIHSTSSDITCNTVYFGPCDKWYRGYFSELQHAGFNMTINLWDQLICTSDQKPFQLLLPHQYQFVEIPFDIAPIQSQNVAPAAEPVSKLPLLREVTDDYNQFVKLLPPSFATWLVETNAFSQRTRALMEQASLKDPSFKSRVEKEFQTWLKQSNHLVSVANLVSMNQDSMAE